jgi:hypothetical protein
MYFIENTKFFTTDLHRLSSLIAQIFLNLFYAVTLRFCIAVLAEVTQRTQCFLPQRYTEVFYRGHRFFVFIMHSDLCGSLFPLRYLAFVLQRTQCFLPQIYTEVFYRGHRFFAFNFDQRPTTNEQPLPQGHKKS